MALKKIGTLATMAAFKLSKSETTWASWPESPIPWATTGSSLTLLPGRYRVELPASAVFYYLDPFENQGGITGDTVIEHETRRIQLYVDNNNLGTVFVTRLA